MAKGNGARKPRKPRQTDLEEHIEEREQTENEADEAVQQAALEGHNSALTDDERRALAYHHKGKIQAATEKENEAKAIKKAAKNLAKSDLGKDGLKEIEDLILLDTPEGEAAMRAELQRRINVAKWAGASIGTQFSFADVVDRTPGEERAHEEGKVAGMRGDPRSPPYDPSVPQHQKWLAGYHDGQTILASAFAKKKIDAEAAAVAAQDTSDPPFAAPDDERMRVPPDEAMPEAPAAPG